MRVGFYVKAVPAIFLSEFATWFLRVFNRDKLMHRNEVFQLTSSSETEFQSFESLIIFNYEVSPFAVSYTNERENFLQFLKHLDANAGTPPNHCGRAGSLKFVLAVKQIAQNQEGNRPEEWIQFFPTDNTGLVLNNDPNLWRRCAEATKKVLIHKTDEYLLFTFNASPG